MDNPPDRVRAKFEITGPCGIKFTNDVSFSTKQIWVCIPRGCLTKLSTEQILEVINFASEVRTRLLRVPLFRNWMIHA